jgi:two-component system, OmpR family, response regulator RegX3
MAASAPAERPAREPRGSATASLLLVEDEPSVGALVRTYLERAGYRVSWVRTGEDALADAQRHAYDLVILDIGLPGMDGFDVCRLLRARSRVPVVMLTARDEEPDRVAGLELGADDYVSKPFSPRELAARVKAVLRRTARPEDELPAVLAAGDVEVRPREREVRVAGEPVTLTAKELDLLTFLLEHSGIVFSREQLLDRVWGLAYPGGTRTVDVHVAQLRRKLVRPELIRTVRGAGYKTARA